MKTYEIKWKPAKSMYSSLMVDVVKADNLSEAKRVVESKAISMGADSVE